MIEHTYFVSKSSWCISIKIFVEYIDFKNDKMNSRMKKVVDGIWLKFADKPMVQNEI